MRYHLVAALALAVTAAACDDSVERTISASITAKQSVQAPVHSLTGSGKLDLAEFDPELKAETYTFAVSTDGAGMVRGQIEIHLSDPAVSFHAEATCLVVEGGDAWVGGVITHSSDDAAAPPGRQFWLRVQDNGQGGSNADRVSFLRLGAPAANCNLKRPASLPFAISGGNLHVR